MILILAVGCGSSVSQEQGAGGDAPGTGGQGAGGHHSGGQGTGAQGACSVENPCEEGTCIFPEGSCDPGATGSCQLGFTCDGPPSGPVCSCDGEVIEGEYAECEFWGEGKPHAGPEPCATGTFACGPELCTRHVEICYVEVPGVQGADPSYSCLPVADHSGWCSHGIGDCSCLDLTSLGCTDQSCCTADGDHQETVTVHLP